MWRRGKGGGCVSLANPLFNQLLLLGRKRLCCSVPTRHEIDQDDKNNNNNNKLLSLEEVKKILSDVKADDIRILQVSKHRCSSNWTDFMVFVTGRSPWHLRNISHSLLFQAKQKQRGAQKMLLPSVEGEKEGKWIVIDSGTIVIHALDEKARAYYNLESLWEREISTEDQTQDLRNAFVKVRRTNNSKKPQVAHKDA